MATPAYKNNGGVYANMDFPPYQYREYPKHIATGSNGEYEVVYTREEEIKLKGVLEHNEIASQLEGPVDPEKKALITKARFLGVPINRLWTVSKLQSVISKAEAAVDNLPPEDEDELQSVATAPSAEEIEDLHALVEKAKELGIKSARVAWGADRLKARISEKE